MLNVLHLEKLDVDKICAELKVKRDGSPQFFMRIPIVIDCTELDSKNKTAMDFSALRTGLLDLGFVLVGVRNTPKSLNSALLEAGWTILPANTKTNMPETRAAKEKGKKNLNSVISTELPKGTAQKQAAAQPSSLTVDRPVRSGQQVYAVGGDLTVLAATSAGSEVMADGSIHVYGALRGRVLAGVKGNESARIFCQSLQAELIVIAGRYQLLDESNTTLIGKPAMIRLDGERLIIEQLS